MPLKDLGVLERLVVHEEPDPNGAGAEAPVQPMA